MARFLIEVTHSPEKQACLRAIHSFLSTGSHYMTNADWGCLDGEHKAWLIVDVDCKEDAGRIVPPEFRDGMRVIQLSKFFVNKGEQLLMAHTGNETLAIR